MALYDLHDQPALDAPVLIMVLEGWIDAGFAAGTAVQTLLAGLDTEPVASFDTDQLLDHRARRPIMHLVDGVNTGMSWPSIELRAGTDLDGNDVLLLLGAEPDHAWHSFTEAALELAQDLGTRLVVGLGAYPAAVPHTRPVTLSVTASTSELAVVSGLLRGSLDVPAGVQAVIESRCAELELPAVGLWAQVPHYVSGEPTPYPAASLTLLDQLESTAGLHLPKAELADEAERTRNRIDVAMAANADHLGLLKTLEERHDEMVAEAESATAQPMIPSADELGAEVERFLRDQDDDKD
ncbi:PAC2 family protein [soil metagenome]